MQNTDFKKNSEGYPDPTAYKAMYNIEAQRKVGMLIKTIFTICNLAGFWVDSRIVLRDMKTGKTYM